MKMRIHFHDKFMHTVPLAYSQIS